MSNALTKNLKILFVTVGITALFLLAFPQTSRALPIIGDTTASTEGLGNFSGELLYSFTSSTIATLIVELTNTSPPANRGYITAFVFNNPANQITGVTFDSTNDDFRLLGGPDFDNRIRASPFGRFDIGASISRRFGGGRNPSRGIAVGDTETFTFSLTGDDLDLLNEWSFVSELSTSRRYPEFFVVRFRGFEDRGSDKVPANAVPEPTTLSLLALSLLGSGFIRKFKKKGGDKDK